MRSVYDAAGGHDGLLRLAEAWHARVLADEVVGHAFRHGVRPDHTRRLAAYWAEALGGPATYSGNFGDETSVVRLHSGNGQHEEMDQRAIACFDEALKDIGLASDDRLRQTLHEYFASSTATMASYPDSPGDVPAGLRIARWSWDGPAVDEPDRSVDSGALDVAGASTVRTSIVVAVPIDKAFEFFSSEMTSWWPQTHHIGSAPMVAAFIEPRVGGRWYELGDDGSESLWGTVLDWDPPRRLALSWHLDGDFRYDPDDARSSRVDVRFYALAGGSTRVELEHSGLDAHGPTWMRLRGRISSGWPTLLESFGQRVAGNEGSGGGLSVS